MEPPIACSLDRASARSQVDEWRVVLHDAVSEVEWTSSTSVRMELRPDVDPVPLVALAQREVACCAFFRFALEVDARGVGFAVTVPPDAVAILRHFASLAAT